MRPWEELICLQVAVCAVLVCAAGLFAAEGPGQPGAPIDPTFERPGRIDVGELARRGEPPPHLIPILHGRGGLAAEYVYTGELFTNTRGGLNTSGATEYRGNFDLVVTADLDTLGLPPGGTIFVYAQNGHGRGITVPHVGDYQFVSNVDAFDLMQLSEYGWERSFADGLLRVKLGRQDCNVDFAVVELGGEFIHSSFGYPPLIPMPTFPDPTLGVAAFLQPSEHLIVQAAAYEGATLCRFRELAGENLVFSILQVGVNWALRPCPHSELPGDFHAGVWHHNGNFPNVLEGCPIHHAGSHGIYLGLDQWVYRTASDEDDHGLGFFAQYAWAPKDRNEAHQYVGAGLAAKGLVRGRDNDVLGAGVAQVIFSDLLPDQTRETAIELFYKASLSPSAVIQPDLQYIAKPSGNGRDAFVFGLRFQVAL